jgi:NTP pyrophosphatase (non-canonical NTP hydrolase)
MVLQSRVNQWQRQTFPNATVAGAVIHMERELEELRTAVAHSHAPAIQEELADVVLLAMGCAGILGFDLMEAVEAKFLQNQKRSWQEPDSEGVVEHIR